MKIDYYFQANNNNKSRADNMEENYGFTEPTFMDKINKTLTDSVVKVDMGKISGIKGFILDSYSRVHNGNEIMNYIVMIHSVNETLQNLKDTGSLGNNENFIGVRHDPSTGVDEFFYEKLPYYMKTTSKESKSTIGALVGDKNENEQQGFQKANETLIVSSNSGGGGGGVQNNVKYIPYDYKIHGNVDGINVDSDGSIVNIHTLSDFDVVTLSVYYTKDNLFRILKPGNFMVMNGVYLNVNNGMINLKSDLPEIDYISSIDEQKRFFMVKNLIENDYDEITKNMALNDPLRLILQFQLLKQFEIDYLRNINESTPYSKLVLESYYFIKTDELSFWEQENRFVKSPYKSIYSPIKIFGGNWYSGRSNEKGKQLTSVLTQSFSNYCDGSVKVTQNKYDSKYPIINQAGYHYMKLNDQIPVHKRFVYHVIGNGFSIKSTSFQRNLEFLVSEKMKYLEASLLNLHRPDFIALTSINTSNSKITMINRIPDERSETSSIFIYPLAADYISKYGVDISIDFVRKQLVAILEDFADKSGKAKNLSIMDKEYASTIEKGGKKPSFAYGSHVSNLWYQQGCFDEIFKNENDWDSFKVLFGLHMDLPTPTDPNDLNYTKSIFHFSDNNQIKINPDDLLINDPNYLSSLLEKVIYKLKDIGGNQYDVRLLDIMKPDNGCCYLVERFLRDCLIAHFDYIGTGSNQIDRKEKKTVIDGYHEWFGKIDLEHENFEYSNVEFKTSDVKLINDNLKSIIKNLSFIPYAVKSRTKKQKKQQFEITAGQVMEEDFDVVEPMEQVEEVETQTRKKNSEHSKPSKKKKL